MSPYEWSAMLHSETHLKVSMLVSGHKVGSFARPGPWAGAVAAFVGHADAGRAAGPWRRRRGAVRSPVDSADDLHRLRYPGEKQQPRGLGSSWLLYRILSGLLGVCPRFRWIGARLPQDAMARSRATPATCTVGVFFGVIEVSRLVGDGLEPGRFRNPFSAFRAMGYALLASAECFRA